MEKKFKEKLKENGQSLKWFYNTFIKDKTDINITYAGFAGQLNGYSPLSDSAKEEIKKYTGR
jgi:hypothetical protein